MLVWNTYELVDLAKLVAKHAHRNQERRNGSDYYVSHVLPVHKAVLIEAIEDGITHEVAVEYSVVALLHDVLEDSNVTSEDLTWLGFNGRVVSAVVSITKESGEDYADYIQRVKHDPMARFVKVRDIRHNLGDDPTNNQVRRYTQALEELR